jgi:hypothetical protein
MPGRQPMARSPATSSNKPSRPQGVSAVTNERVVPLWAPFTPCDTEVANA